MTPAEFDEQVFRNAENSGSEIKVLKMHEYAASVAHMNDVKCIFSFRDVRDVIVSLCKKENKQFNEIFNQDFAGRFLYNYDNWMSSSDLIFSRYEDIINDIAAEVRKISGFLGIDLQESEVEDMAAKFSIEKQMKRINDLDDTQRVSSPGKEGYDPQSLLHSDHIQGGRVNAWSKELSSTQIAIIEDLLGFWLINNDYQLALGATNRSIRIMLMRIWRMGGHILSGRLLSIIRNKRKQAEKEKRKAKWTNLPDDGNLIAPLTSASLIKLYKDSFLSKYIYLDDFEQRECTFVKRYLKPGDTFLDAGANIGLFSIIASEIVGDQGRVLSFEPFGDTFERLTENIALNHRKNVTLFQQALSDKVGDSEMTISTDGFDAWNSLAVPALGEAFEKVRIKTNVLDELFRTEEVKPVLIKIDVEGWELHVINGGVEMLTSADAPVLMVEFAESNSRNAGYTCKDLYNRLEEFGYSLYSFDDTTNELYEEPVKEYYSSANLMAIKDLNKVKERIS